MDDSTFLKMIFDGYVNYYGALRFHTVCSDTDMTQLELSFFTDLGLKLGFIPKRNHEELNSNPRDLVWIKCLTNCTEDKWNPNNTIFLHLERENDSSQAVDAITGHSKLNNSARYADNRYLVGIFGWVTPDDFNKIINALEEEPYKNRNILIIAWIGENKDNANKVHGLLYSGGQSWERIARAYWDKTKFWYLYFEQKNIWEVRL
jgi:hypothetical protein